MPEDNSKKLGSAIVSQKKDEVEFKTEKPEVRTQPTELKKRNSNLFRNMMGHLNKAKTTLEKEKPLVRLIIFDKIT